jgi:predicted DNA-binding transcriptional regulator AlpA
VDAVKTTRRGADQDDDILTAEDVCDQYRMHPNTLYRWRSVGRGPQAYRIGRRLLYRRADVEAWFEQHAES